VCFLVTGGSVGPENRRKKGELNVKKERRGGLRLHGKGGGERELVLFQFLSLYRRRGGGWGVFNEVKEKRTGAIKGGEAK